MAMEAQAHRPTRALGIALAWAIGAVPVALGLQRCPVAVFFHASCPGCGMTRAMHLLFHGEVLASLRMHPLALPSLAASGLIMLATTWVTLERGTPTDLMRVRFGRFAAWTFLAVQAVTFAFWAARMLGAFGGPVQV